MLTSEGKISAKGCKWHGKAATHTTRGQRSMFLVNLQANATMGPKGDSVSLVTKTPVMDELKGTNPARLKAEWHGVKSLKISYLVPPDWPSKVFEFHLYINDEDIPGSPFTVAIGEVK